MLFWNNDISFEGFQQKRDEWYGGKEFELCDSPLDAQFALDLIYKTLIDDKDSCTYLTTISQSREQNNSVMLDSILWKYSRRYRKFIKKQKRKAKGK